MDLASRQLLIAMRSPFFKQVDPRDRCEDCGRVLTRRDFQSYWDGSIALERERAVPRVCCDCVDELECNPTRI